MTIDGVNGPETENVSSTAPGRPPESVVSHNVNCWPTVRTTARSISSTDADADGINGSPIRVPVPKVPPSVPPPKAGAGAAYVSPGPKLSNSVIGEAATALTNKVPASRIRIGKRSLPLLRGYG